ncbi:hypothetical protein [Methylovulum psychrotolerans]|nr:hypothetical protein [Methylovulum psychrotolerans]
MLKTYFIAKCTGNSAEVLSRVEHILLILSEQNASRWPDTMAWQNLLPVWFTERFAPEMTHEQALEWLKEWRSMSSEDKALAEQQKGWDLFNWLGWFHPDKRFWSLGSASIKDANVIEVTLLTAEDIFPSGAIQWLFIACGAISFAKTRSE